MQIKKFIGIDVSKDTLDFSVVVDGKLLDYKRIENTTKAINKCISQLTDKHKAITDSVFCMEYTGVYSLPLMEYLSSIHALIWMESGVRIRKSMGLVRGKNDKIDSQRIAMYAYDNKHKMKLWEKPRKEIQQLANLLALRSRLVKAHKQLLTPLKELATYISKQEDKILRASSNASIKGIEKDIGKTETAIKKIIMDDESLQIKFKQITSVDGVGMMTAAYLLVTTNEFKNISDAKKYACYAGVAPFEHSSGTAIRGKTRVSNMANKKVKTILHMAAIAAVRMKGELQDYYHRKIAEGKHVMAVLNAVRNKIILRIFACVNNNKLYQKNYTI